MTYFCLKTKLKTFLEIKFIRGSWLLFSAASKDGETFLVSSAPNKAADLFLIYFDDKDNPTSLGTTALYYLQSTLIQWCPNLLYKRANNDKRLSLKEPLLK